MAAAAVTVMAAIATGADTTRPFGWAAVTVTYGYSGGKEVYQSVWVYVLSRQAWGATMMGSLGLGRENCIYRSRVGERPCMTDDEYGQRREEHR